MDQPRSEHSEAAKNTHNWYAHYVAAKGLERNDVLRNPEVLFQALAYQASIVKAVRTTGVDPESCRLLDVGCGTGNSLLVFLSIGLQPEHMYGVDILENRVAIAQRRFPASHIACEDASHLRFADESFDLVAESTMFMQVTDDWLAAEISREMLRVVKPGGFML